MQTIKFTTAPVIVIESEQSLEDILKSTIGENRFQTEYRKFDKISDVSGYSILKTHLYNRNKVYVFNETTLELVFIKGFDAENMKASIELLNTLSSNFDIEIKETLAANPTI